jgi:hypothetical protein
MAMAETLILKIRTEALRGNLEKMMSLLDGVPDRRTDLNNLLEEIKKLRILLRDAHTKAAVAKINLDTDGIAPETAAILAEVGEKMSDLQSGLRDAGSAIESMLKKCFRIQETEIGRAVASSLHEQTQPCIDTLVDIQPQLQRPDVDLQQQWRSFQEHAEVESRRIFTEYIEFLGGLALRDTGFDAGICLVADELIQKYSAKRKTRDPMLAIPTHQQAVVKTLSGIIPVTFPDWTIWSLPSTAFEFWHVVAQKDLERSLRAALHVLTNANETVEPRFNDCLADAFATYTMGPAYAYFAILLLLNPSSPYDDVRAHAIFQMLERMDSQAPEIAPAYKDVREQLIDEWNYAITQIGVKPSAEECQQVSKDKARATLLVQALWNTLIESTSAPFTIAVWNEIQPWVKAILTDSVETLRLPVGAELRHVLNAAWLARIDANRDPKRDITGAADKLAERIIKGR